MSSNPGRSVRLLFTGPLPWLVVSAWWTALLVVYLADSPEHFLADSFFGAVCFWLLVGWVLGHLVLLLVQHPHRYLGLVPVGLTLGLIVLWLHYLRIWSGPLSILMLTFWLPVVRGPLNNTFLSSMPLHQRGLAAGWQGLLESLGWLVLGYWLLRGTGVWGQEAAANVAFLVKALFLGLSLLGAILAWSIYLRPALELLIEPLVWPLYRISASGPGLDAFPERGPVLIVANHSAWLDPLWLAKVLPRRLIPMMTSRFYDLPVLRWLMRNVVRAIRVEATGFRRLEEIAPELNEAVQALDRGECVVIFPEGRMRRTAEQPLRQFGQGIWHILQQRPQTPVVVCWIEGGWGSFFSYWNGPPTKNKRFDFWRRIRIGVSEPQQLPPELLADQRRLRKYLMEQCLQTRRLLNLPPLTSAAMEAKEEETS